MYISVTKKNGFSFVAKKELKAFDTQLTSSKIVLKNG